MSELVPGSTNLGVGFNGFGSYDAKASSMARLFDTSTAGSNQWTNPATKTVYTLPVNVGSGPVEKREGTSVVFESRSEMSEFFKVSAGVEASFLSFSGSLSASYSKISKSLSEYFYGMTYAFTDGYELSLLEKTREHLAPEVLADPDFSKLPEQYNPTTQPAFFRLFEKYGTYFISSLRMGGRIFYDSWIEKSFGMTKTDVSANMSLEYAAVFSAEASANWSKVDKRWSQNRQVQLQVTGGNTEILSGLFPSEGNKYATQFAAWINSVEGQPGPVGFGLTGIEALFSGDQYEAVKQASQDYSSRTLRLQAGGTTGSILVNGKSKLKVPADTQYGVGYVVVDRSSLELLRSGVNVNFHGPNTSDQLANELRPYQGHSGVIVAILFWDIARTTAIGYGDRMNHPSQFLMDILNGLGAGSGLAQWQAPKGSANLSLPQMSYAIVGIPGSSRDSAFEDFASLGFGHWNDVTIDLEVFLRPESTPGGIVYTPS